MFFCGWLCFVVGDLGAMAMAIANGRGFNGGCVDSSGMLGKGALCIGVVWDAFKISPLPILTT